MAAIPHPVDDHGEEEVLVRGEVDGVGQSHTLLAPGALARALPMREGRGGRRGFAPSGAYRDLSQHSSRTDGGGCGSEEFVLAAMPVRSAESVSSSLPLSCPPAHPPIEPQSHSFASSLITDRAKAATRMMPNRPSGCHGIVPNPSRRVMGVRGILRPLPTHCGTLELRVGRSGDRLGLGPSGSSRERRSAAAARPTCLGASLQRSWEFGAVGAAPE